MLKKYSKTKKIFRRRKIIKKRIYKKRVYKKRVPRMSYKKSVEKKHMATYSASVYSFAKDNSTASGHLLIQYDNTNLSNANQFFPCILQGLDDDDRIGQELKLTGMSLRLRIRGQPNFRSGGQYRIIIFSRKNASCQLPQNLSTTIEREFLDFDKMENTDVYTVSSSRNQEFYRNYIVHYNRRFTMRPDPYYSNVTLNQTGTPATYTIPEVDTFRDHMINLKLNRSVRYDKKSLSSLPPNNPLSYGDMCILFLANKGDIRTSGGATDTRTSGFDVSWYCNWYYTDS